MRTMPNENQFDPTDLSGEARAREAKGLARSVAKAQDADDFKWLMADERGRRLVWKLLSQAKVFHSTFGSTDAETNFLVGQRNMGLYLLGQIHELCPERYVEMLMENREDGRPRQP